MVIYQHVYSIWVMEKIGAISILSATHRDSRTNTLLYHMGKVRVKGTHTGLKQSKRTLTLSKSQWTSTHYHKHSRMLSRLQKISESNTYR